MLQTRIQTAAQMFLQDQQNAQQEQSKTTELKHPPKPHILGPRFEGDGCDSDEPTQDGIAKKSQTLPMEEVELLDKIMALLTEATHIQGRPSWILDDRFQKGVCVLLGKPLNK